MFWNNYFVIAIVLNFSNIFTQNSSRDVALQFASFNSAIKRGESDDELKVKDDTSEGSGEPEEVGPQNCLPAVITDKYVLLHKMFFGLILVSLIQIIAIILHLLTHL